ncbi:MAG: hypothetical protein RJA36_50 [Pseudomonadota bacterium]|jgi:hypothetical protein
MASVGGTFVVDVAVDPLMVDEMRRLTAQIAALSAQPKPVGSIGACVGSLVAAAAKSQRVVSRRSLLGFGLFNRG